jgi:flagellin-like protein
MFKECKCQKNTSDAFTGLEAAIVLIAFVVVAAVFSYVVLSTGFSQPRRHRKQLKKR